MLQVWHGCTAPLELICVIAWVVMKFGINITSVVLEAEKFHKARLSEISHFQYNESGIDPKFSQLYSCYSMLIQCSLWEFVKCGIRNYGIAE